jgi:hypothetical protein
MCALLLSGPRPAAAAAADPVLEWIGVMNNTVLAAGTAPNVTGRVVASAGGDCAAAKNPKYTINPINSSGSDPRRTADLNTMRSYRWRRVT